MKKLILFAVTLYSSIMISQQDIQLTQFDTYSSHFNPASIIKTKQICGNLNGRNQWNGLTGNPNTVFANISYRIPSMGIMGISFAQDHIGNQTNSDIKLNLAKGFQLTSAVKFGLGLSLNYLTKKWGLNYITPDTPYYQDNAIPNATLSKSKIDMDFGLYVSASKVFLGLSTTHLTEPKYISNYLNFQSVRHYYIYGGYLLQTRKGSLDTKILAKSDGVSTQLDLKPNFWFNNGLMIGLSYRLSDAIAPMIGYQKNFPLSNFKVVYSYDITTSSLNQHSNGSHEITLSFCLFKPTYRERHTDPRHMGNYDFGPRSQW